ncbi:hypothetical protein L2E82_50729 [Cichorium intybus]|nr:hypothetical protein L2E82_50729 [Cichorium intybus]
MPRPCLMYFYSIGTLIFLRLISCVYIPFCDESTFSELCNSISGPQSGSHEPEIKSSMSHAQAIKQFLAMAPSTSDARAKATLVDCLELYEDLIHYLDLSKNHMNPIDLKKWLNPTLANHQECQNGFKDSTLYLHLKNLLIVLQNFLKLLVYLHAENKPSSSNLSMISDPRHILLVEGGATTQADLVVAQDGSGDFSTVTEAIKASKNRRIGTDRFVIHIKSGIYVENVVIESSMSNLTLIGDGIDATTITSNRNTDDGFVTYNTATFQIWGPGFVAVGITFENTAGPGKQQALALLSASDLSAFYKCSFKGYQDTLCLLRHQQFYRECDIYGTIDFIFGDAAAVLQNCNIYVRRPIHGQENTITAQGRTDSSSVTGFVIHNSRVVAAPDSALGDGAVRTFLGRPWRDYSRVIFVKCDLDSLIDPQGWMPYRGSSAFDRVYYAEYMNTGKGADTGGRVTWPGYHILTAGEVEQFSVGSFLAGDLWIPQTGVPFDSGI